LARRHSRPGPHREAAVAFVGDLGSANVLLGFRSTAGAALGEAPYAIRNVLLYFLMLFVLKVFLRRQWPAAIAFTVFFTILNGLRNDPHWTNAVVGLLYYGAGAFVIVR
jgi:hypothetical protein